MRSDGSQRGATTVLGAIGLAFVVCAVGCRRDGGDAVRAARQDAVSQTPTAAVRLILIADIERVLEPCGCTSRPRGGVDRLAAQISELKQGSQHPLVLAAGEMFASPHEGPGPSRVQDDWQADVLTAVLERLGIAALAVGAGDRSRESARLATLAREGKVVLLGPHAGDRALEAIVPSALLHAGDLTIGTVVADATPQPGTAVETVAREVTAQRARGAALVIAFVHRDADLAQSVAQRSGADFVVQSGIAGATAVSPAHGALLVSAGQHGERVLALDVWPGGGSGAWPVLAAPPSADAERGVVVHERDIVRDAPSDPVVRGLLDQLFARINAHNAEAFRAAASPSPRPRVPSYVGSRTCAACHTPEYFWWQKTPHARAFETLLARGRQLDLDCIGCHVSGYDKPGGATIGHLEELKGVGCESCHGAGSAHVDNPQQPGRAIRRGVPEATCVECHDREHSDLFRYAEARARLLVPGHGQAAASHAR